MEVHLAEEVHHPEAVVHLAEEGHHICMDHQAVEGHQAEEDHQGEGHHLVEEDHHLALVVHLVEEVHLDEEQQEEEEVELMVALMEDLINEVAGHLEEVHQLNDPELKNQVADMVVAEVMVEMMDIQQNLVVAMKT